MGGMGSTVVRRQLGRMLHELRVTSGRTIRELSAAKLGSKAKMSRVEAGQQVIRVADVWAWCDFYGADRETVAALSQLAPGTERADWWEPRTVPPSFSIFIGLERTANRIRCFEPQFVFGLGQTEAYARAVMGTNSRLSPEIVEKRVRLRMERQQRSLNGVSVVMAETALRVVVGSPEIMAEQIDHLRALDADIRVLPFAVGPPPAPSEGTWALLDFESHADPSVAYVEGVGGCRYLDKPRDRANYEMSWRKLVSRSVPIGEWTM